MNCAITTRDGSYSNTRRRATGAGGGRTAAHGLAARVVDDDPTMLKLAAAMLGKIGAMVRTTGQGAQALLDFSRAPSDLVLTDYEMPAIKSHQLGRRIKSRHPGTRAVIMTGLCRAAVTALMSDGCIDGWLFKPFNLAELNILLERVGLPAKSRRRAPPRIMGAEGDFTMNQRTSNESTDIEGKTMSTKKQYLKQMEKRSLVRNRTQSFVACSSLTAKGPDAVSHGHMMNCSCEGTCIKLNHKIHDGSIVMIKATSCGVADPPEGFRTLALAEVKWSKRLEDGMIPNYVIGLRYLPN